MRLRQLSDLETDVRRLADLENGNNRFPSSEVWEYINKAIAKLWSQLITVSDHPFYEKEYSFQTQAQQRYYPLPFDFVRLTSVLWANAPTGPFHALEPCTKAERVYYLNAGYYGGVWPHAYCISGSDKAVQVGTTGTLQSIEILPAPTGGATVTISYVPTAPRLQQPTDTLDGVLGFEDAVTTWAAILMRRKDDLDTSDLERDFERHMEDVRKIARRRDGSAPPRIQQVRGTRGRYSRWRGGYRGGWGYGM